MPVAADLVAFLAASAPDEDTTAPGGAIDLLRRPDFTQLAANDTIEVIASAAATQTVTVEARSAAGSIVSQTVTLNGAVAVPFNTLGTIERVLSVELGAASAATVTVRRTTGAVTIAVVPIGERGVKMLFRKTASDPSVIKNYYAKFFWKNLHATQALLTALVKQNADPSGKITHVLAAAVNDSVTTTNRVTAPTGTFDDTDKAVPGTDLAGTAAIGVWLRLQLAAGDAAQRTTYTTELSGQSV